MANLRKQVDMTNRTCIAPECNRPTVGQGLCDPHYRRKRRGASLEPPLRQPQTTEQRFWAKVTKTETCWLWTGRVLPNGYAVFYIDGKHGYAHRWSYEHHIGPIPAGFEVDHVWARGCEHRHCVNPAHLEAVTKAENNRRSNSRSALQARQTHCGNGHEFTAANTYVHNGHRSCRACRGNPTHRR